MNTPLGSQTSHILLSSPYKVFASSDIVESSVLEEQDVCKLCLIPLSYLTKHFFLHSHIFCTVTHLPPENN
jgi:hypothetical protein